MRLCKVYGIIYTSVIKQNLVDMSVNVEAPKLSDDAQFALEFTQALDAAPQAPDETRLADEREAIELARHLDNVDEQLLVLDGLYGRAAAANRGAVARAIEAGEKAKYGEGLIEVTSLEDLAKAGERMLGGKNPAIIVRANTWGENVDKAGELIPQLIGEPGQFTTAGVEQFPKKSMPTGSSALHIDNFIRSTPSGFRYAFSAAQLNTGHVLFMGGIAGKKARNTSPKIEGVSHPYDEAQINLEADPKVKQQYSTAQQGRPKGHTEFTDVEGRTMVAVVLNPGDTVIWPQGGPGAEAPAWHGFRKIGDQERSSTSYHYVQTPQPQPEQPAALPPAA